MATTTAPPSAPPPPSTAQPSANTQLDLSTLMPTEEDLAYEEELLRNPYSLKTWLRYLQARETSPFARRRVLFERAVAALPGSYKLWKLYLDARRREVRSLSPNDRLRDPVTHAFERSLVTMHKMPVIWDMYLEHVCESSSVTAARRAFDRALAALPLTQHAQHVWPRYLAFVQREGVPIETAVRVYRRYLQIEPAAVEEFVSLLSSPKAGRWAEAARRLASALDDDAFRSLKGRTRHALWLELCDLVTKHPREVEQGDPGAGTAPGAAAAGATGLDVEAVLRGGIRRHPEESGRLWAALADYFTRRGLFERARDVYEEAMRSVSTVRDFGLVYDALTHFEESLLSAKMEQLDEMERERERGAGGKEEEEEKQPKKKKSAKAADAAKNANANSDDDESDTDTDDNGANFLIEDERDGNGLPADVDLRLARLELLASRRAELLSSVSLRQNPHNVGEWHRRAKLFAADPRRQVACLTEAVRTVDAQKCGAHYGRPFSLWVALAKVYESHGDVKNARAVFERAVKAGSESYKYVDDLAAVWCEWIEMELRHKEYKGALGLARRATGIETEDGGGVGVGVGVGVGATPPLTTATGRRLTAEEERLLPIQARLFRSQRLWALACDLEESLGSVESASAAYERAMALRVATPQLVLNYASMLREQKRWEAAFRAYERGVTQLFKFPHAADLWSAYLEAFVARYGGTKLERARDLFETCLRDCPPESSRPFYEAYARLEEAHGLARRAMDVYDRALASVPRDQRGTVVDAYLARAAQLFGVPKLREVYESAIEAAPPRDLPDADVRRLCVSFAQLEARLGEIDRARGIFAHGSHLADPRLPAAAGYWEAWRAFEVAHGNEDTFREMLRLKRSVAASFATLHVALAPGAAAAGAAEAAGLAEAAAVEGGTGGGGDAMAALEAAAGAGGGGGPAPLATGTRVPGFVSAGVIQQGKRDDEEEGEDKGEKAGPSAAAAAAATPNPEEIELGEDDEEGGGQGDDDDDDAGRVRQRAVPAAVFGGLAAKRAAAEEEEGGPAPKKARP